MLSGNTKEEQVISCAGCGRRIETSSLMSGAQIASVNEPTPGRRARRRWLIRTAPDTEVEERKCYSRPGEQDASDMRETNMPGLERRNSSNPRPANWRFRLAFFCMVQGMKHAKPDSAQLATQAAQSLAVAVALRFSRPHGVLDGWRAPPWQTGWPARLRAFWMQADQVFSRTLHKADDTG